MKVIGTVETMGQIEKPSKKDVEKGYRFIAIVREDITTLYNGWTFPESIVYQIKSVDKLDLEVGEEYIFTGRLWEMRTTDQESMRGLTNFTFKKRHG